MVGGTKYVIVVVGVITNNVDPFCNFFWLYVMLVLLDGTYICVVGVDVDVDVVCATT